MTKQVLATFGLVLAVMAGSVLADETESLIVSGKKMRGAK